VCQEFNDLAELYECYLAIIPGVVLAKLYKEYSNELLENNVRAFLGQTGKYNKGIRETIRKKPQMFLPYNNGITATAENVETVIIDNQLYLTKLNDFQIVNGGQTTASLFHTQKKFKDADLSKIFVQMKLTVIKDNEQKNIEVPNIARFANSQNKVSELDLSSFNPYFVRIESLSRKKYVNNPVNKNLSTLWYFERVNGQYKESLNKLDANDIRKFKEQNPTNQKLIKSDVAKFINLWEQEPHNVSLGAQKNFIQYTKKTSELVKKNILPGDNFYKKLIANAIVFKTVDKLFGRKNIDAIGDTNLKSLTVAYTISFFHFLTNNRLDLWKIYEEQKIDNNLQIVFKSILVFVLQHLINNANNSLISEYAKKESSWIRLKGETYTIESNTIENYLISLEEADEREKEKEKDNSSIEETIFLVSEIYKLGLNFWDGLKLYVDNNIIEHLDFISVFDLVKRLKDHSNLTNKDISTGKKGIDFISENPSLIEEIKSLSPLVDYEEVEIKVAYDKMKLISKDEWNKIMALAEQIKIFNNLELSNLKSIHNSIRKNEIIKEQSILKGFDSIKKLRKFGIKF